VRVWLLFYSNIWISWENVGTRLSFDWLQGKANGDESHGLTTVRFFLYLVYIFFSVWVIVFEDSFLNWNEFLGNL
jgi:hypothetical protein